MRHDPSTDDDAREPHDDRGGHTGEVRLSNPDKLFFEQAGHTKLDLANYYVEVADAALIHLRERPRR
jgi:DNA primase